MSHKAIVWFAAVGVIALLVVGAVVLALPKLSESRTYQERDRYCSTLFSPENELNAMADCMGNAYIQTQIASVGSADTLVNAMRATGEYALTSAALTPTPG